MDLTKILGTVLQIGADLPAYKALFDQVVATFSDDDQAVLKARYAEMKAKSDAAHAAAQGL
jgi:hypothetical protein